MTIATAVLALIDADEGIHSIDDAAAHGWSLPIVPFVGIVLALLIYWRGWLALRKTRSPKNGHIDLPILRAASFTAGCAALWMALASPIDALDDLLLSAHMAQHFILMAVAPPLIVLGAPQAPMLRGLPRFLIRGVIGPLLRLRWLHAIWRAVTHPMFIWLAMNIAYLGWHVPALFDLTFTSETIHNFEHLCFFWTCIAFWWVVLSPWPSKRRWPQWTVIPYLLSADILNTALSATLVFSGKVLYAPYAEAERVTNMTPLQDQAAAGAGMWVANSTIMLLPAILTAWQLLQPRHSHYGAPSQKVSRSW